MCGCFGFISRKGGPVNLKVLRRIARITERRGPHAWGMAWIDGHGRLKMYKQVGRVTDSLGLLAMAADARILIGHCRYATHGDPADVSNNHPHPADGGWFVHNGVIPNHWQIAAQKNLHAVTECDSEILGLLVENDTGPKIERVMRAVKTAAGRPLVMLGLWKPGNLIFARNGNPLHAGATVNGTYLASLAHGLPGRVREIPDGEVSQYKLRGFTNATV